MWESRRTRRFGGTFRRLVRSRRRSRRVRRCLGQLLISRLNRQLLTRTSKKWLRCLKSSSLRETSTISIIWTIASVTLKKWSNSHRKLKILYAEFWATMLAFAIASASETAADGKWAIKSTKAVMTRFLEISRSAN